MFVLSQDQTLRCQKITTEASLLLSAIETRHLQPLAPPKRRSRFQTARYCIRAIARYSVVKEQCRAVVAAGPPLAGGARYSSNRSVSTGKLTFFGAEPLSCRARKGRSGKRLPGRSYTAQSGNGAQLSSTSDACQKDFAFFFTFFPKRFKCPPIMGFACHWTFRRAQRPHRWGVAVGYSARMAAADTFAEHAGSPGRYSIRLSEREPSRTLGAFAGGVGLGCGRPVIVGDHEPQPAVQAGPHAPGRVHA